MSNTTTDPEGFIESSEPYHMTINDVLALPKGKTVRIFFLDRNMFDMSWDEDINPKGVPIKPSQFFRKSYFVEFTRKDGITGTWRWMFEPNKPEEGREFHVDTGCLWYPLRHNRVPEGDNQRLFNIPSSFAGKHYSNLPTDTRLGWRGPMMLANDMDRCPDIIM